VQQRIKPLDRLAPNKHTAVEPVPPRVGADTE
jgi:hypothetical protein